MPWQELTGHITDSRVHVRSKSGNEYPADTDSRRLGENIYRQLVNDAHDDVDFWAWVEFPDDAEPVVKDFTRGQRPEKPPWEYP